MKKVVIIFGIGATLMLALLIFGVGYLLFALIPKGGEFLSSARDGVFILEENGRKIERKLSRECVAKIEEMTTMANMWNVFQAENWKSLLPETCLRDFNMQGTPVEPGPQKDLEEDQEWETQDSETI